MPHVHVHVITWVVPWVNKWFKHVNEPTIMILEV